MGEVYRAADTNLKRQVAIKVLPESAAADPERLARLQREAELLAALNHPNIAHIHGLEKSDGSVALVMELVEGPTLADRIARGAIAIEEALPIAKQIAEALDAAHDQGIIHRDLKPANIKVREDGTVKVLDFGLAKALEPAGSRPDVSQSPTITTPAMTAAGMILGTAAYMSPEQVKGRPADKRSDVWAFGCVLYEMLSGERAFKGDDVADIVAIVLKGEIGLGALSSSVPPAIRALIRGCLRKDRKERIGDISTALFVLAQPPAGEPGTADRPPPPLWRRPLVIAAACLLGAAISTAVIWRREPPPSSQITRFTFTLPQDQVLTTVRRAVAFSPDGTRIVYSALGGLFTRKLAEFDARPIPGAETGTTPAFSPDGQSVVFYANSAIKRVSVNGGTPVTIYRVGTAPRSLAWTRDGILFSDVGNAIMRVSQGGGKPKTLVDLSESEDLAYSPQLLPDEETLLFSIVKRTSAARGRWDDAHVVVQSIKTGVRKPILDGGSDAQYVPTGHIVYMADGTLFAVPFDLSTLAVTGVAVPVVEGVRLTDAVGLGRAAQFAFSNSGSLVYAPGPPSAEQFNLMVFDRTGGMERLNLSPGKHEFPRVSPDGKRIAFATVGEKEASVWIYDLSGTSAARRLTFDGDNRFPIWSADGTYVAFQSNRHGDLAVFWQAADGGTAAVRLTTPEPGTMHVPESASSNGDALLFSATKDFKSSLWTLSLGDRKATPFSDVKDLSLPPDAMFSPDGRWVAYQVGEPNAVEGTTYVQPFPPNGTRALVSQGGRPLWSRDGKEMFLVPAPGRLVVVGVRTEPTTLAFTSPVAVPRGFGEATPSRPRTFDIMPNGRIVGVGTAGQAQGNAQVRVVVNWFEELKAKAPAK